MPNIATVFLSRAHSSVWRFVQLQDSPKPVWWNHPVTASAAECRIGLSEQLCPKLTSGTQRSADLLFDRYDDRYQTGNRRTIQHRPDAGFHVSERKDTRRTPAYPEPPNSGPGGRWFESTRPDHSNLPGFTALSNDFGFRPSASFALPSVVASVAGPVSASLFHGGW
jgi:hypothetical protein